MTVSSNNRRKRYTRCPCQTGVALVAPKSELLRWVGALGPVSLPQLARLCELSPRATRYHMRTLFDGNLVDVVPVARFSLADPGQAHSASWLYGSAPNLYTVTRAGAKTLERWGGEGVRLASYGVNSSPFLAHELGLRDFRVYLELGSRTFQELATTEWREGSETALRLDNSSPGKLIRADAVFLYRTAVGVLQGLVEWDRGTERGSKRWQDKIAAYGALFAGGKLKQLTGYSNARLLIVVPDEKRLNTIAELIRNQSSSDLQQRVWIVCRAALDDPDLTLAVWRQPGSKATRPLLTPEQLGPPVARERQSGQLYSRAERGINASLEAA